MTGIIGDFRVGEDIALALDATAGDATAVTAVFGRMKPAISGATRLTVDGDAEGWPMTVSPQTPASAGWTIGMSGAQTSLLAPGIYAIDARLIIGAAVEMTDQTAFITLSKGAI